MQIAPPDMLAARVARVRGALAARELDALVITSLPNIAYLTGFFASAAALIATADSLLLIGDGRYASVLATRAGEWPAITPIVLEPGSSYDEAVVETLAPLAGARVGFEAAHMSVQRYRSIASRLAGVSGPASPLASPPASPKLASDVRASEGGKLASDVFASEGGLVSPKLAFEGCASEGGKLASDVFASEGGWSTPLVETDGIVEELRLVKDAWEISRLRDGAARLSNVAKCILQKALADRTESEVAAEIDGELRRAGFERPAFDTIVAAGPNAALPHARPSGRRIERGELTVIDFGGVLDGYCTDLTRTVVAGPAGGRERDLIEQVTAAQFAAFDAVKPGGQPEAVDQAARETLARFGLAEAFTHGTGHGLGLEIHEGPRVTRGRAGRAEPSLAPGMVVTLEPGVYFPGWGGVRIEDDVLVTEDGAEWLTDVPRMLMSNA